MDINMRDQEACFFCSLQRLKSSCLLRKHTNIEQYPHEARTFNKQKNTHGSHGQEVSIVMFAFLEHRTMEDGWRTISSIMSQHTATARNTVTAVQSYKCPIPQAQCRLPPAHSIANAIEDAMNNGAGL